MAEQTNILEKALRAIKKQIPIVEAAERDAEALKSAVGKKPDFRIDSGRVMVEWPPCSCGSDVHMMEDGTLECGYGHYQQGGAYNSEEVVASDGSVYKNIGFYIDSESG